MEEQILQYRVFESRDWATILFVVSFVLIVVTKTFFESRFSDFLKLIFTDKYHKIYRDNNQVLSWFNVSMFVVHIISFSFLIQFFLSYYGFANKYSVIHFVQISTGLTVFVLSKYLIDKIIATSFGIEEFAELYNIQKVNYRFYAAFLLLPVNVVLFYNDIENLHVINFIFLIILVSLLLTFVKNLKINKNMIWNNLFYFILYLCILEIGPYYFMFYLFKNS